jgi:putative oxidoreductase
MTGSGTKGGDVIHLIGRVALGATFVKSGLQKLTALSAFAASLAGRGIPASLTSALIGATVEFAGGVLIVAGFRTREASLLMVLFVIVATAISHRYWEYAGAAPGPAQARRPCAPISSIIPHLMTVRRSIGWNSIFSSK